MEVAGRLRDLLDDPVALVLAVDALGGATTEFPDLDVLDAVPPERRLESDGPLDALAYASHGAAVVAFESARRSGHGTARVTLRGEDAPRWLEMFDLRDSDNCFLVVIVPDTATQNSSRNVTALAPRSFALTLNVTGIVESISPAFVEVLGWAPEDVVGESSMTLIHPDDHEAGIVAWVELLESPGSMTRTRQRFRKKDQSWLWCETTDLNALDDPTWPRIAVEVLDISREVAAESALQRRETVLDRLYRALPTGVLVLDPDGSVAASNERWGFLTGGDGDSGLEALLSHVVDRELVEAALADAHEHGRDHDVVIGLDDASACRHGELRIRPLHENGVFVGLLVTIDDTTEAHIQAEVIAGQLRRDPLTGAVNRRGLDEVLSERLAAQDELALLYIDLDDFKSINDTLGHAHGDFVLREVAMRLAGIAPPDSVVARLGGDEFLVVMVRELDGVDSVIDEVLMSMDDLREQFAPFTDFGASIGAVRRIEGDDFDSIIARADAAMYASKSRRRRRLDDLPGACAPSAAVSTTA